MVVRMSRFVIVAVGLLRDMAMTITCMHTQIVRHAVWL